VAEHESSIDIDAPPEIVWEHLVTVDGLSAWMGERVDVEPTAGGRFSMHVQGSEIRGQFVEVEAPRRLVFTWGVLGSADHPPGSSTVEFRLAELDSGTRVMLKHSGLPLRSTGMHAAGWAYFLPRLAAVASGAQPEDVDWNTIVAPNRTERA
jgi:uncharacterized protein YndB with AHSA1/START domain